MRMQPDFEKANEIYFRLGIIYKQQQKFNQSLDVRFISPYMCLFFYFYLLFDFWKPTDTTFELYIVFQIHH